MVVELAAAAVVAEADAGEEAASSAWAVAGSPSLEEAFDAASPTLETLEVVAGADSMLCVAAAEASERCWPVFARLCCFWASDGEGERERFLFDSSSGIF